MVEGEPAVVEAPEQRGEGAGLVDAGLPAEGAGGLAGGRGADHAIAGRPVGVADAGEGGGLARPGDADDQVDLAARLADADHRPRLAVRERPAEFGLLAVDGRVDRLGGYDCRAGPGEPAGDVVGDGRLDGEDRGAGVGPLGGAGHADERDDLPVGGTKSTTESSSAGSRPNRAGARRRPRPVG